MMMCVMKKCKTILFGDWRDDYDSFELIDMTIRTLTYKPTFLLNSKKQNIGQSVGRLVSQLVLNSRKLIFHKTFFI